MCHPSRIVRLSLSLVMFFGSVSCTAHEPSTPATPYPEEPTEERVQQLRSRYEEVRAYEQEREASGAPDGHIAGLYADAAMGIMIASGFDRTLLRSEDGVVWSAVRIDGLRETKLFPFVAYDALFDSARGFVYLATSDGVFRSADSAWTFERFSAGFPAESMSGASTHALEIDLDRTTGELYARIATDGFGVYKTGCGTADWKAIGEGLPQSSLSTDIAFSGRDGSVYIVNGASGAIVLEGFQPASMGIYRGVPDAARVSYNWEKDTGLALKTDRFEPVAAIVSDPVSGELYVCAYLGLFWKDGEKWFHEDRLETDFVSELWFDSDKSNPGGNWRMAVLSADGFFFRGGDGSWSKLSDYPWSANASILSAAFFKGALYVATNDGQYYSEDGSGRTWTKIRIE